MLLKEGKDNLITYFYECLKANRYLIVISSAAAASIGIIAASSPYLGLVLAAIILVIMLASGGLSIPLIILSMPIRGVSLGTLGEGNIRIGDLLIGLLIVFYFFRDPVSRTLKFLVANPLDLLVMLFVAFSVFSIAWADNQEIALLGGLKLIRNLALYLLLRYEFLRNSSRAINLFIGAIILSTWAIIADLVYWIWSAGGIEAILRMGVSGPLTSASPDIAVVRAFGSGATKLYDGPGNWFLLSIFAVGGWWMGQKKKRLSSLFGILTIIIATTMLLILLQRSPILGFVVGVIAVLIILPSNIRHIVFRRVAIPGVILFLPIIIFLNLPHLFEQRFSPRIILEDPSSIIRQELWKDAFDNWTKSPFIGVGIGNSISAEKVPSIGSLPHNIFLQAFSELGIIGFGVFIALLVTWAIRLSRDIKLFKERCSIEQMFFAIGIFGGMIAYLISGIAAQDFYGMEPWIYLAITSAMMSRIWMKKVQKQAVGISVSNLSIR